VYYHQDPRLLHAAIGLVTESGELLDAIKKAAFYGKALDTTNIKEEAGDILWYLALLFNAIGTSFESEQERVINKLKVRFPEKFNEDHAEHRDLVAERKVLETDVADKPTIEGVQMTLDVIVKRQLNIDCPEYHPSKTLEDMGADSLDLVELLMEAEDTFEIEISDEAAKDMKSPAYAAGYIWAQIV